MVFSPSYCGNDFRILIHSVNRARERRVNESSECVDMCPLFCHTFDHIWVHFLCDNVIIHSCISFRLISCRTRISRHRTVTQNAQVPQSSLVQTRLSAWTHRQKGFTHWPLGDTRSFSGLTSRILPLGSMLNFDADVKKTTARHQCEKRLTLVFFFLGKMF